MDTMLPGITRRRFFNHSILAFVGIGVAGSGSAVVAFLWPKLTGGFGSKLDIGSLDAVLTTIRDTQAPVYVSAGRFYVVPAGESVLALYQKCPHLGCRVPFCPTSQWFECGCHQSKYNQVGEKKAGPAPRGMDRFAVAVSEDGHVVVDTGTLVIGPPFGTDSTGQEAEGPHCV